MRKIAVFCGGGMKGYTEAVFSGYKEIEADMYAGTSIGGIISCARAAGKPWSDIARLFKLEGKTIFRKPSKIRLLFKSYKYNNKGLKKVLEEFFGNTMMHDLSPVCVTAMCISKNNYGPYFFSEKSTESVVNVCMATSAAPSYFPSYKGFIDGGVFMNNPVFYAFLKASRHWPNEVLDIVNVGSGESILDYGKSSNGVDLIGDVIQHMLNGNEMASREMMEEFSDVLGIKFRYHDFVYNEPVKLDSIDKFRTMRRAAHEEYIRSNNKEL